MRHRHAQISLNQGLVKARKMQPHTIPLPRPACTSTSIFKFIFNFISAFLVAVAPRQISKIGDVALSARQAQSVAPRVAPPRVSPALTCLRRASLGACDRGCGSPNTARLPSWADAVGEGPREETRKSLQK